MRRIINPWFDHAAHQLKSKRRVAEKKMAKKQNSRKQGKDQQINKAYKTYLQNNKKEHIKVKLSDANTNNIRAFYKTVKMLEDNQDGNKLPKKDNNLQDQLAKFFLDKIEKNHTQFDN